MPSTAARFLGRTGGTESCHCAGSWDRSRKHGTKGNWLHARIRLTCYGVETADDPRVGGTVSVGSSLGMIAYAVDLAVVCGIRYPYSTALCINTAHILILLLALLHIAANRDGNEILGKVSSHPLLSVSRRRQPSDRRRGKTG